MSKYPTEGNEIEAKRTRGKSKKYIDYVMDKKTSGCCPGCKNYVTHTENGVVCSACDAFWHYGCAKVSVEEINQLGNDEFYCENHRSLIKTCVLNQLTNSDEIVETARGGGSDQNNQNDCEAINLKMVPYILNTKKMWKTKLKNLSKIMEIGRKDNGHQYAVIVNTVTYTILMNSIVEVGKSCGLMVRRADIDPKGSDVQAQFDGKITKENVADVPVTVTFFHTTNTMLIQIKGKRNVGNWAEKLEILRIFVNKIMTGVLWKIEKLPDYEKIKENIEEQLKSEDVSEKSGLMRCGTLGILNMSSFNKELNIGEVGCTGENCVSEEEDVNKSTKTDDTSLKVAEVTKNAAIDIVEVLASPSSLASTDLTNDPAETNQAVVEHTKVIPQSNEREVPTVLSSSSELLVIGDEDKISDDSNKSEDIVHKNLQLIKYEKASIEEMNQVVVSSRGKKEPSRKMMMQSFNAIKSNVDEKNYFLYNIILKMKEKYHETLANHSQFGQPVALNQLNQLTLQLITMQKESDDNKKKCKDLEVQLKDLKMAKKEWDAEKRKIKEADKQTEQAVTTYIKENERLKGELDKVNTQYTEVKVLSENNIRKVDDQGKILVKKDLEISGYKLINDDLRTQISNLAKSNEKMRLNEEELNSRINILQAVAGEVKNSEDSVDQLVVITSTQSSERDQAEKAQINEIEDLRRKLDVSNKENSLLKDSNEERMRKLEAIDKFYKEILDQKDETIKGYTKLVSNETENSRNLKRLLIKFRSDNELKLIKELKVELEKQNGLPCDGEVTDDEVSNIRPTDEGEVEGDTGSDSQLERINEEGSRYSEGNHSGNSDNNVEGNGDQGRSLRKRLCRYGRNCEHKDSPTECSFTHEVINKPCRFGIKCLKGDRCLFLHENVDKPKYPNVVQNPDEMGMTSGEYFGEFSNGIGGGNSNWYSDGQREMKELNGFRGAKNNGTFHQNGRGWLGYGPAGSSVDCHGASGVSGSDNLSQVMHNSAWDSRFNMFHESRQQQQRIGKKNLCKYGVTCQGAASWCTFDHNKIQKTCNSGENCSRQDRCLFLHGPSKTQMNERCQSKNNMGDSVINDIDAQWLRRPSKNPQGRS